MKLTATQRDLVGKRASKLRREGKLPAIVYGHHVSPTPLSLDRIEFQRVFAHTGRSQLIDLEVDGGRSHRVLVKEVQIHPRRSGPIHVDLFQVSLREKLHVDVPVVVLGESPAVKRGDGDILQVLYSVAVECLPDDIPEGFQVDVSGLDAVDAGIRVGELPAASRVTVLTDPEELIIKVQPRRVVEVEEEVAEAAAEAAEAPAAEGEAGESGPAAGEPSE